MIPDCRTVATVIGSLTGPGSTVNAKIVHVYSVNGLNLLTVPTVLLTAICAQKF